MAEAGYLGKSTPHPGDGRGHFRLGRGLLICGLMTASMAGCVMRHEARGEAQTGASKSEDMYLMGERLTERSNSAFRGSILHGERTYLLGVIPYSDIGAIELRIGKSRKMLSIKASGIGKTTISKVIIGGSSLLVIGSDRKGNSVFKLVNGIIGEISMTPIILGVGLVKADETEATAAYDSNKGAYIIKFRRKEGGRELLLTTSLHEDGTLIHVGSAKWSVGEPRTIGSWQLPVQQDNR